MTIRIDGTNTAANPGITGTDTDTGLQFGTDEVNIVTGGSTRATVDSAGRLLVGTSSSRGTFFGSSPAQILLEQPTGIPILGVVSNSNDTGPAYIALGKSRGTSSGSHTVVQANDFLGVLSFQGADGDQLVEAARIDSFVDGTPGNNDMPGVLRFATTADGSNSPAERMRINNAGQISINTTAPLASHRFTILETTTNSILALRNTGSDYANRITFYNAAGNQHGSISATPSSVAYNTSSDYRLKENIAAVTDGITRLQQLNPCRFNFILEPDKTVDGFIAHEVQNVVPEAINGEKDAVDEDGNPQYQGIDQSKLVPLLTAALQEAIAKIETLETTNASQAATIAALDARLTALEGGAAQ